MKKIVRTIPFAFLLFRFYFISFDTLIQKVAVFLAVMLYIVYNFQTVFSQEERDNYTHWSIVFSIIFILILSTPFLHGTSDYSYARKIISHIFDFACWSAFAIHVKKLSKEKESILYVIMDEFCRIMAMYISFTILSILIPTLRSFWQSVVSFSEKEIFELQYAKYIGRIGWDGFAGFNATLMCTFGVLICVALLNKQHIYGENYIQKRRKIFLYLIILLVGNLLYGRTGLVASLIILFIYVVNETIVYGKAKILLVIISMFFIALISIIILKNYSTVFASLYSWAFEPLINYFNSGYFSSSSTTVLMGMYRMPPLRSILIGDGYYTNPITGGYYKSTDVGILRLVYYWGVIPTLFVYWCTIKVFKDTPLYKKGIKHIFFVFLVLFEMKGEAYRIIFVTLCALTLFGTDMVKGKKVRLTIRLKR